MDSTPTILLVAGSANRHAEVRAALERSGLSVTPRFFHSWPTADLSNYRLAIVDSTDAMDDATAFARNWLRTKERPTRPLIWLADTLDPKARLTGWEAGATICLAWPFLPEDLQAQATALLRLEEECSRLHSQAQERNQLNEALLKFHQQHDTGCRLARHIQRSFQPRSLPEVGQARFAVIHRSRAGLGGDFYSVQRVDDDHTAFYLGDMMSYSLTASLLAAFIQRAIVSKKVSNHADRLLAPNEVLYSVNRELLNIGPMEQFACLTYGYINGRNGELQYASAGPSPRICLPREGEPQSWLESGGLLGLSEGPLPLQTHQLKPGDRQLFFTDGLMGIGANTAEAIQSACRQHRDLPLAGMLAAITQELLVQTPDPDDFTMLGIEMKL